MISMLARGVTQSEVAEHFGLHPSTVNQFAKRWQPDIEARRELVEESMADIWIADKRARVIAYADDVERIDELLGDIDLGEALEAWAAAKADGDQELEAQLLDRIAGSAVGDYALLIHKHRALKSVAEELGQLPNRQTIEHQGAIATYRVEGVDMEALR